MLLCKACNFTVFCQKKYHKKKEIKKKWKRKKKRKEREWHQDGLYLKSRSCQFFIQKFHVLHAVHISLKNRWMSVAQVVFLEDRILHLLLRDVQKTWGGYNLPDKQFRNKIHLFFLPSCQKEINKVIFVWLYILENNCKFRKAPIVLAIGLIHMIRFFLRNKAWVSFVEASAGRYSSKYVLLKISQIS